MIIKKLQYHNVPHLFITAGLISYLSMAYLFGNPLESLIHIDTYVM